MKKLILIAALLTMACLSAAKAHASGVAAGTTITNKATAHFTVGASSLTADSNIVTVRVVELVNSTLTWQDAAPGVTVSPGQTNRVTTYRLTNTGNGNDSYTLLATGASVTGDNFDPTVTAIYLDANGNGSYDAGTDTLYTAGVNDPSLVADGPLTLFVLSTIPAGVVDGNTGNVQVTATSKTGTGAPGKVLPGLGDGGVDAVIGPSGGTRTVTGTYVVLSVVVNVTKAMTVIDPFGGAQPVPGATIQYTITVKVTGTGTAAGVVITDPVPVNTTYTAGTLKLNGNALTDAADADAGDVGGTTAGTATVSLGSLTSASTAQTIMFDVKIN